MNGAGIFALNANLQVSSTMVGSNSASALGGGILAFNCALTFTQNVTISPLVFYFTFVFISRF
jgi:hypothetical protein